MRTITTEITIAAPVSKVWSILTDLENYHTWNPFIIKSEGKVAVGEQLRNTMHLQGMSLQVFTPTILEAEPNKSFRWLGSLFVKGIFDGEHCFYLSEDGNGNTQLIQEENFSGILAGITLRYIGKQTEQGFEAMNEALKVMAEKNI